VGELSPQDPGTSDVDAVDDAAADSDVPGQRGRNSWVAPGSSEVVQVSANDPGSDSAEPAKGRRLLARIPGLSQLAEQSGWVGGGPEKSSDEDPGWVFHEGDGPDAFAGWLYHYADGAMVDADGVEYALPTPAPAVADDAVDAAAEPDPEPEADPEAELEPESEPEPEARPEPHLSVVETPAEPEAEPEPEAEAEAEPQPEPEAEPTAEEPAAEEPAIEEPPAAPERPSDIPRFVEYSTTHIRGYLLGAVFVVASVTAVLTLFVAVRDSSAAALVIAGGCMLLALVAWWALLGWKPTVVSITEGVLEITRGGHSETFELTDPSTYVNFNGRPGSPAWAATVRNGNGPRTVLRSSHVKPRQFERIVRHYRSRTEVSESEETSD
jgi:hypothetical protein